MTQKAPVLKPLAPAQASLTERTIQAVRSSIRSGVLIPGELYSVYQLSKDLGVSRSPVREALLRLEETGMIRFERNKGFRILLPGPRELAETFAVRIALEVPAARRAAKVITDKGIKALHAERDAMKHAAAQDDEAVFMLHDQRLHGIILESAGNDYARKIVDTIRDATRLVGASTIENQRSLIEVFDEHLPIIEALEQRNGDAAAQAMERHIRQTGLLLLQKTVQQSADTTSTVEELWAKVAGG